MKRSFLKRGKGLNKSSVIGRLKKTCDKLLFEMLKIKRGARCEVCGRSMGVGPSHILTKATHPRLRYSEENIVLLCWLPCHYYMHHDSSDPRAKRVEDYIIKTKGANYRDKLLILDRTMGSLREMDLICLSHGLKQELTRLGG